MTAEKEKSAAHWDTMQSWATAQPTRVRWWESERIQRDINKMICGKPLDGVGAGLMDLLGHHTELPIKRAISIGCGPGVHEAIFVKSGIVEHFDLFDISPGQIAGGIANAESLGISDHMNFRAADAFDHATERDYDLVFWCGSLHHMPDTDDAVRLSHELLRPGGIFLMNEYVGADRFQWPNTMIALVNFGRAVLPEAVFRNPADPRAPFKRFVNRPTIAEMDYDPSEAVDAEAIIPTVKRYFPDAKIKNIGGNFYHVGLSDILTNIPENSRTLQWCMAYDRLISRIPHYAVALAQKLA